MSDRIKKHFDVETPQEMDRAVDRLADKLAEMDQAEGIFGERMLGMEELDHIAGGVVPPTNEGTNHSVAKSAYR